MDCDIPVVGAGDPAAPAQCVAVLTPELGKLTGYRGMWFLGTWEEGSKWETGQCFYLLLLFNGGFGGLFYVLLLSSIPSQSSYLIHTISRMLQMESVCPRE